MTQQYDNTNRFTLFKNENKRNPNGPDYSGSLNVDGVEFFIDGWVNDGRKGQFFSGSIKRKDKNPVAGLRDELRANSPQAPARGKGPDPLADEVPFAPEVR